MTYDPPKLSVIHGTKFKYQARLNNVKRSIRNNKFLGNLRRSAEENPVATVMVLVLVINAAARIIKAHGEARGSRAYAKQVEYRIRNKR